MCAALRFCVCFILRRCVSLRQVHKAVVDRVQAESYLIKVFSGACGKLRIILRRQIPITYIVAFSVNTSSADFVRYMQKPLAEMKSTRLIAREAIVARYFLRLRA